MMTKAISYNECHQCKDAIDELPFKERFQPEDLLRPQFCVEKAHKNIQFLSTIKTILDTGRPNAHRKGQIQVYRQKMKNKRGEWFDISLWP
jgi:hypothetical protein